jgi:hypothetical protein
MASMAAGMAGSDEGGIFRCQNFGSKPRPAKADSAQFRCQFAAKKNSILALFAASPCLSLP